MPFTAMTNLAAGVLVTEADMDALRGNITYLLTPGAVYTARGAVTTTSTDYTDIAGLSAVHTAYGGITTIHFVGDFTTAGNGEALTMVQLMSDATVLANATKNIRYNYTYRDGITLSWSTAMASGAHTIKVQWSTIATNTAALITGKLLVYGG